MYESGFEVKIDTDYLTTMLTSLVDDELMLQVHNLFAKMCDPYVPMDEGVLAQSTIISPTGVTYTQPYAHYQYVGMVYGPNIPMFKDGLLVGFRSIPGRKKDPTGREINYSTERHPLATKEWDKAMMRDKGEEFIEQVRQLLIRKAGSLYG